MTTLDERFPAYQGAVDAAMQGLLSSAPQYSGLYDMLRYHLGWLDRTLTPTGDSGKKLRPTICFLSAEIATGDWRPALPAATAIELVHNFSLIHDDIEDGSPTRRYRETVWTVWGAAHGINAGDALLIVAQQALTETEPRLPPPIALGAQRLLLQTCRDLCEGQYLDLLWEDQASITVEQYLEMIERKTARLFQCAAELGVYCAQGNPESQRRFGAFARALGMAFQVADDLSGIWAPEAETGKPAALDLTTRKKTLPVIFGLEASGPAADRLRELFALDRHLTEGETIQATALLDELEAREQAGALLRRYREEALAHLAAFEASPLGRDLRAFVEGTIPT